MDEIKEQDDILSDVNFQRYLTYQFLAIFFHKTPIKENIEFIENIDNKNFFLKEQMEVIKKSLHTDNKKDIKEDFFDLFIGVSGSLIQPYASWYISGQSNSTPLSNLRADLRKLGIKKAISNNHTEDHISNILSTHAILIDEDNIDKESLFFINYIDNWVLQFCNDIERKSKNTTIIELAKLLKVLIDKDRVYYKNNIRHTRL